MQAKTLLFIPTYNEVENVERIFQEIRSLVPGTDVLFLDDNSPDGTGQVIDGLVSAHNNVNVLHRECKSGIGSAHREGIKWAYDRNYEMLITMDCDFTHSPSYLINFLRHSHKADIIVGSRYLKKHSLPGWNLFRKFLTNAAHFLTVRLLRMPYDATGAFRLYNLKGIDRQLFSLIASQGYSFFFESLFILHFNGKQIVEIPIELPSRTYGTSKMTSKDAWNSLVFLFRLFRRKQFNKNSLRIK